MKIEKYEDRETWLEARRGRVTGTRLKDLITKGKPKKGFYEIIAERVAIPAGEENAMDRGTRLEDDAIQRFMLETGKKVNTDLVILSREDDPNICISPDGYIETGKGKKKAITEAVECKCLNSAAHIEAWLTKEIPSEYEYQALQYFIVNDKLQTLYFCFYDPRMPKDFFYIEIKRKDIQEDVDMYLVLERETLEKIAEIEKQLTF
ncbi:MAG: YqaJ viral recombinase family protein [Patescibacteria group bacterium]|nr:YqaJ viral recombinase family protein [Patescibacteria group bacterium]